MGIPMEQKELGRRLQAVRRQIGLKQTEIAEKIGTSALTISRMERGENVSSATLAGVLCIYSKDVSLNALFAERFPEDVNDIFTDKI